MSGRQSWREMPVAASARRTCSAGKGRLCRSQLLTFCCDVPIASANLD